MRQFWTEPIVGFWTGGVGVYPQFVKGPRFNFGGQSSLLAFVLHAFVLFLHLFLRWVKHPRQLTTDFIVNAGASQQKEKPHLSKLNTNRFDGRDHCIQQQQEMVV